MFLGIVCIGKGSAVMVLEMMNTERFLWACRATPEELKSIQDKYLFGKLTVRVAEYGKQFDERTQGMINKVMCSNICPCYHEY